VLEDARSQVSGSAAAEAFARKPPDLLIFSLAFTPATIGLKSESRDDLSVEKQTTLPA